MLSLNSECKIIRKGLNVRIVSPYIVPHCSPTDNTCSLLKIKQMGKQNDKCRKHLQFYHSEVITITVSLFISNTEIS